jgi:hypothetical protein
MAITAGSLEQLASMLASAVLSVGDGLTPSTVPQWLAELGLDAPPDLSGDAVFATTLANAATTIGSLDPLLGALGTAIDEGDPVGIVSAGTQVLNALGRAFSALDSIAADFTRATSSLPNAGTLASFATTMVEAALESALVTYLDLYYPLARRLLSGLTLIELTSVPLTIGGVATTVTRRRLHLERIGNVVASPLTALANAYQWGTASFDGAALFRQIGDLFTIFNPNSLPVIVSAPDVGSDPLFLLTGDIGQETIADMSSTPQYEWFALTFGATTGISPPGIQGTLNVDIGSGYNLTLANLSPNWTAALSVDGELAASTGIQILPPATLHVVPPSGTAQGSVGIVLTGQNPDPSSPLVLFGATGGSGVQVAQLTIGLSASFAWDAANGRATADIGFRAKTQGGQIALETSQADGFLQALLPSDGITSAFDFDLTWDAQRGVRFSGGAGLSLSLPLHLSLGPIEIAEADIRVSIDASGLTIPITVDCGATLGPISVDVQGLGASLDVQLQRGNLGLGQLAVAFLQPKGLGVVVDAGPVVGGGFIAYDDTKKEYSAVIQLLLFGIQLDAIALLDTVLPDGSAGYSFILVLTLQSPDGIPLGFGFTLTGVGGLVGINRAVALDALQAGVRQGSLDAVLFPEDPVAHAPQIISEIATLFPPAMGSYVFGPMLQLSWGDPPLLTASLGLILELPAPVRIALLGVLSSTMPNPLLPLIVLNMDIDGTIDFGLKKIAIDASLFKSYVVQYSLQGDMAFRLLWGNDPSFALSVGGFNHSFQPPAGFPVLRRASLSIGVGDNPSMTSSCYFAVTSNTVQFGSAFAFHASAAGVTVDGGLSFDVLFQFAPFNFVADMTGFVTVQYSGQTLANVQLSLDLQGPNPWKYSAYLEFDVLGLSISTTIKGQFGSVASDSGAVSQSVLPLVAKDVSQPGNWSAALPSISDPIVTLAPPNVPSGQIVVHPMGQLQVRQTTVPLRTPIDKFGNATPLDGDSFAIASTLANPKLTPGPDPVEMFAMGQFKNMTDDQKLAAPAFQPAPAGIVIQQATLATGFQVDSNVTYTTHVIDDQASPSTGNDYAVAAATVSRLGKRSAAAYSPARRTGTRRFVAPGTTSPITTSSVKYVIATTDTLKQRADLTSVATTQYMASQLLRAHLVQNPQDRGQLQVLPTHEVAA